MLHEDILQDEIYGFSITNIKNAIKHEVLESCLQPEQYWAAYVTAVYELLIETRKDRSWLRGE